MKLRARYHLRRMDSATPDPLTTERSRRVATVDIGTNSIRLLVAEARPDGSYALLDDEKVVARLGRGMTKSRVLDGTAMRDAARAVAHMRAIAKGYNVELLRVVATWAVRVAENRDAFVELVQQESGLTLDVIDGSDEARLAFLTVQAAFDLKGRDVAVVDIGGGSTEVVLSANGLIEQVDSFSLGAVHLTEAVAMPKQASADARLRRLRRLIDRELKTRLRHAVIAPSLVIGVGGTFTTLATMDQHSRRSARNDAPAAGVRGHELRRAGVRRHLEHLNAMSARERQEVSGLSPDRAEIIVAGLAIAEMVMKRLRVNVLQVHDRGIRDGLLLSMAQELFPEAPSVGPGGSDRIDAVRQFAARCNYERDHSEHVTELALQIYDRLTTQVADLPALVVAPAAREMLRTAGILHDIGYSINYARHHKHSYHLIMHSELPGYSSRELELIANVARYHRRAHPKSGHPNFKRLTGSEKELVRHLAAILRIADGLDRAHSASVDRVELEVERRTAWFTVAARSRPEVDLWGAARKSLLFARVYDLEPRFHWAGETRSAPPLPGLSTPS